jgi:hypothetical protein
VGDARGLLKDPETGDVWVKGNVEIINGRPHQTRWVQEKDGRGNPIFLSKAEFEKAKAETKEGFRMQRMFRGESGQKESFILGILILGTAILLARR